MRRTISVGVAALAAALVASTAQAIPPVIGYYTPSTGSPGTVVTLYGNLPVGTSVYFNGTYADQYTHIDSGRMEVKVPATATTGPLSVSNSEGTHVSGNFVVIEPGYTETVIQSGTGWSLVRATGSGDNGQTFDTRLYKITDGAGIANSPLPASLKQSLVDSLPAEGIPGGLVLAAPVIEAYAASEQQGSLTPLLQAIAEPADAPVATSPVAKSWFSCSDKVFSKSGTINKSLPLTKTFSMADGFTGSLSLTGTASVTGAGAYNLSIKRAWLLGFCVPVAVNAGTVQASGTATIEKGATLTGTVNYEKSWEWEIAKPVLYTWNFSIYYIPVKITFRLPIAAGLDLKASTTGTITFTGAQKATGTFNYTCDVNGGCTGTQSFTQTNPTPQLATASISGRVQPSVWAQVGVRAALYETDNKGDFFTAYGQLGLRGYAHGDLWAYYGNNCGDANADGLYETVSAATFDLDYQLKLTGQAATGNAFKKPSQTTVHEWSRRHIKFWEITSSSAITPMLTGAATQTSNPTPKFGAQMRPCWPYSDNVNYNLTWGDGTSSAFNGAPQTARIMTHAWNPVGAKTLTLTAQSDAHGRTFSSKTTTRNVTILPGGALEMRCYAMGTISGCGVTGYWANSGASNLTFRYTSARSDLQVVYPMGGTFPYDTNNGVIYFGLPSNGTLLQCPSGTAMTMSAWTNGSPIGTATATCP